MSKLTNIDFLFGLIIDQLCQTTSPKKFKRLFVMMYAQGCLRSVLLKLFETETNKPDLWKSYVNRTDDLSIIKNTLKEFLVV